MELHTSLTIIIGGKTTENETTNEQLNLHLFTGLLSRPLRLLQSMEGCSEYLRGRVSGREWFSPHLCI